jgi:hypothetical protein
MHDSNLFTICESSENMEPAKFTKTWDKSVDILLLYLHCGMKRPTTPKLILRTNTSHAYDTAIFKIQSKGANNLYY